MTTLTASEAVLLDTNILVYAMDATAKHHEAPKGVVDQAQSAAAGLGVTPQTAAEFFAVVTDPRRVEHPPRGPCGMLNSRTEGSERRIPLRGLRYRTTHIGLLSCHPSYML